MTKKQIITKETSLIKNPKDDSLSKCEQLIWAATYSFNFNGDNVEEAIEKATNAIIELRKAHGKVNLKMSGESYLWLTQIVGKAKWK